MNLTNSDCRLLLELDNCCRMPLSSLSKKVRISQQLISYKIKNYLKEGLILSFTSYIDYTRFGYLNFRVYFKINYLSTERFHALLKVLRDYQSIIEVIECSGKYDLIAVFASSNPSEFNKKLKDLIGGYPAQLKNYIILTTVVTHYYDRAYLTRAGKDTVNLFRDPSQSMIVGGDRDVLSANTTDMLILSFLQTDSRLTNTYIGRKIKLDPKTIKLRIKNMIKSGMIKTFKPVFNVQSTGFIVNKILLKYHNLSVEKENELLTFCKFNPNIVELTKIFGEWDLEITVETNTREEFQKVYISIREKFEDIISDFESFPVFKTHKKEFLPASAFEAAK